MLFNWNCYIFHYQEIMRKNIFITFVAQWMAVSEVCKIRGKWIWNTVQYTEWLEEDKFSPLLAFSILYPWTSTTKSIQHHFYFHARIHIKVKYCILSFAWFNIISIMFWKYNFKSKEKKHFLSLECCSKTTKYRVLLAGVTNLCCLLDTPGKTDS